MIIKKNRMFAAAVIVGFFALGSLIWWQNHMINTGSAIYYAQIRWIFTWPYYLFIFSSNLSGALLFGSIFTTLTARIFFVALIGFCVPAAVFASNYLYFDSFGWALESRFDSFLLHTARLFLSFALSGWTLALTWHLGNQFKAIVRPRKQQKLNPTAEAKLPTSQSPSTEVA